MISTQTFTSLDCVREEGVKLKKQQRIGDDLHNVSRGAISDHNEFNVFLSLYLCTGSEKVSDV